MSLSLMPNSRVGHFTASREDLPDIGTVKREYRGSGGTNQFIWGNGFKYKEFYGGLSLGYLFGSIRDEKAVLFEDVRLAFHDYALENASYRGFSWKAGLQYVFDLSGGKGAEDERNAESITLGLSGNSKWSFRTISTILDARMGNTYLGLFEAPVTVQEIDTLAYQEDLRSSGRYPGEFSLGVVYRKSTKWILGANYRTSGWSSYQNDLHPNQQFTNASEFAIGGQFIPDAFSFKYYYQRIRYRAGLRFGTDPRLIDGNQIKDFGVSVGFGLPIVLSRQLSFVNLGVEFNKHGGQIPIKENFVRFNVGVTLNNNLWFLKRKFN